MHPVAVVALAPFLRENRAVELELIIREVRAVPDLLKRGLVDLAITDFEISDKHYDHALLGYEEFVAIESTVHHTRSNDYLDVDSNDQTTAKFLSKQKQRIGKYRRCFRHDDPGILRGVVLGLGRGVLPKHSIPKGLPIRQVKEFTSVRGPVFLNWPKVRAETKLIQKVRSLLIEKSAELLSSPPHLYA